MGALLLIPAADAQPVRVRLTIELDPALQIGPRVTTTVPLRRTGPQKRYVAAGTGLPRSLGVTYWRRPYFYWSDGTYDGPTILGDAMKIENAPILAPVRPSPPTAEDDLVAALRNARYQEVIEALEPLVESADPFDAPPGALVQRYLVALEGGGRTGEAARLLVSHLESAPDGELAPLMGIDRDAMLGSAAEPRRLQRLAADYLGRTEDPRGAVLLASYLWEGGRPGSAQTLLEEARDAGLSRELATRLMKALAAAAP